MYNTIWLVNRSLSFYVISSQREFSNRKKSCVREEVSDVNKSLWKNILLVSSFLCTSSFVHAPPQLTLFTSPTSPSTPRHMRGRQFPTLEIWQSPDKFTRNSKTRIYVYVYIYIALNLRGQWNSSISRKIFLTLYLIHTLSLTLSAFYGASNQLIHKTINRLINPSIDWSTHRSIH